jgi:hypothetical protein
MVATTTPIRTVVPITTMVKEDLVTPGVDGMQQLLLHRAVT